MKLWPPWSVREGLIDRTALIAVHLAVVGSLALLQGLRFESAQYLAMSTQFLSLRELADHLGRSLGHLMSQPPGYNLLIGLALQITESHFTYLLWGWHLLWACFGIWAVYGLGRLLSGRRWPGLLLGLVLPLFPDWLLYETWSNYTFPVMTYGLILVFLACRFHRTRDLPTLLGLAGVLNLLMLTRSVFHLVLFGLVFCGAMVLVHRDQLKRLALWLVLPTLILSGGWYTKNLIQFGFFGASGWSNMGLMRAVAQGRDKEFMKKQLEGTPQAYLYRVWLDCPGFFCDLVDHYFHALDHPRKGTDPVLYDLFEEDLDHTRLHRNMNNINYLAINRDCGTAAKRIILADPAGYLANVGLAYTFFTNPPTKYGFLEANRDRLRGWVEAWEKVLYFRLPGPGGKVTPLFYLYFLLLPGLGLGLFRMLKNRVADRDGFDDLLICGFCLYAVGVSISAELGENHRFSFLILPLFWTWLAGRAAGIKRA